MLIGQPLVEVRYQVACDAEWKTRGTFLRMSAGADARELALRADPQQRWWRDGHEVEQLRGCIDVDLSFTPATNTLPIRRLRLAVGSSSDVVAAWVRIPELSIQPLAQRYVRLEENTYRYESDGFAADLSVDDLGLVVRYGRYWEREAAE